MSVWKRNQPVSALRRVSLFIYDIDGQPAPATTDFSGANELLVDQGDGHYVAAGGTLENTDRPLIVADDVIEAVDDSGNDTVQLTAHGLKTGDGPIQFTTTGGLPAPLAVATDYWIVYFDDNNVRLATTLALALQSSRTGSGHLDLTTAGSGTNTLVDTASTRRLNDGNFIYNATSAELSYRGCYFGIRVSKTDFRDLVHTIPLVEETQLHTGTAAAGGASTITLDAAASATNDLYADAMIIISGGTGKGQVNTIASYVGGTKVATVVRAWGIQPDATSEFVIMPAPSTGNTASIAAAVWDEVCEGSNTYGDIMRALISLNGCKVTDFTTGTLVFKSINAAKTRWTVTVDTTGRLTATVGDLTP